MQHLEYLWTKFRPNVISLVAITNILNGSIETEGIQMGEDEINQEIKLDIKIKMLCETEP